MKSSWRVNEIKNNLENNFRSFYAVFWIRLKISEFLPFFGMGIWYF
jgi:hypothetical protein